MRVEPEVAGVAIVLRGDFSPAIFTPAWFALHDLLPESAADDAEGQVVHPQVTTFAFDWLRLDVTTDHLSVKTSQAPYVRLRDLVLRVFREHLRHTILNAFGINRYVHFPVPSFADGDRIGRILAPVKPWGACGADLGLDDVQGGMKSLTMSRNDPKGRPPGDQINIRVEPSNHIGQGRYGVYVDVNDHYATDDTAPGAGERLMMRLEESFEASLKRSDGVIDHIMSLAENREV